MARTITFVRAGNRRKSPRVLALALTLALELGALVGYATFVEPDGSTRSIGPGTDGVLWPYTGVCGSAGTTYRKYV